MPINIAGPYGQQILANGPSPFANLSYSQFGEDAIIDHILFEEMGVHESGCYVDVGAFHPYRYSNTALLYLRGWRGINIDPTLEAIELFRRERPEDISICAGISDQLGEKPFYRFEEGAVNSFSEQHRDVWIKNGFKQLETVMVETSPLYKLLERHLNGRSVDYLNIDAEGLDQVVLSTFDFSRYRPKIITIELGLNVDTIKTNPIYEKLTFLGYHLHSVAVITSVFRLINP